MPTQSKKSKHVGKRRSTGRTSKSTSSSSKGDEVLNGRALRKHLLYLLRGEGAHIDFERAVSGFPYELQGVKPEGIPFTAWRILEHMRIAQWDIVEFSKNPNHVSPQWPAGYWPAADGPPDKTAWTGSVKAFRKDLKVMEELVASPSTDLFAKIPHGSGQTVLREALLVADHNSYHLGQLVMIRRLVGSWPER